jgi:3-mercaptopyruvate sulfurtransferase SseA
MRPLETLLTGMVPMVLAVLALTPPPLAQADPSKDPQCAQQTLPPDVKPEFISIDELVKDIQKGLKPLIIDVRTAEEFRETHILGAVSAPLAEFRAYLKSIPRDRLTILY